MANPNLTLKNPAKGSMDWDATMSENFNAIVAYAKANNTTVADALAALDNKVEGKWRVCTSLEEIGITTGEETIKDIALNMPNRSTLIYAFNINNGNKPTEYPFHAGSMQITKLNLSRTYLECFDLNGGRSWVASYNVYTGDPVAHYYSGWRENLIKDTAVTWINIALLSSLTPISTPRYSKDNNGWVHLIGSFYTNDVPALSSRVLQLPVGFRPSTTINTTFVQATGWATVGYLSSDGYLSFAGVMPASGYTPGAGITIDVLFKAV